MRHLYYRDYKEKPLQFIRFPNLDVGVAGTSENQLESSTIPKEINAQKHSINYPIRSDRDQTAHSKVSTNIAISSSKQLKIDNLSFIFHFVTIFKRQFELRFLQ